jgi:hypothetical protein
VAPPPPVLAPPPVFVPPPALALQARPAPTETQTGALGAKQHAPLNPFVESVQFCSVAPGYAAHAEVALAQVGGGGQLVPPAPPPPFGAPVQVLPAPAIAKQMGAFDGKQHSAA